MYKKGSLVLTLETKWARLPFSLLIVQLFRMGTPWSERDPLDPRRREVLPYLPTMQIRRTFSDVEMFMTMMQVNTPLCDRTVIGCGLKGGFPRSILSRQGAYRRGREIAR